MSRMKRSGLQRPTMISSSGVGNRCSSISLLCRSQIEDEAAIHLGVEGEIEVEGFVGIAKGGEFAAAVEEAVAAPGEFVVDQAREQIHGRHGLGLSLTQSSLQHGGYAAQPELS